MSGTVCRLLAAVLVLTAMAPAVSRGQGTALERFTVSSDGHAMAVWARRPATATASVLLVHGRTWSSRPDFDLQVPGLERSVLRSLAARRIAAYAVDLRGYGETSRDATGWNTPRRSAADVANVLAWVRRQHPGLPPPALLGWSRGAAIAMLAAQGAPVDVSALVLFGFAFDPSLQFGDAEGTPRRPARARNTAEAAASDFISPGVTPPAVVRAFVDQALRADPILVDVRHDAEFNALDPRRLVVPTLVLFGERDPAYAPDDVGAFVRALGTRDRTVVVLPGADHAAQLEDTHTRWIDAVAAFVVRRSPV